MSIHKSTLKRDTSATCVPTKADTQAAQDRLPGYCAQASPSQIPRAVRLNPSSRIGITNTPILEDAILDLTLHLGPVTSPDLLLAQNSTSSPVVIWINVIDPIAWFVRSHGTAV